MAEKNTNINFVFRGVDEVSGVLRSVNKNLSSIQAPVKRFQGQITSLGKSSGFTQLAGSVNGVGDAIGNVMSSAFKLGLGLSAAAYGAYAAFNALIGSTIEENSQLAETSKKTGVAVEKLQQWQYAAEQSGSSAEGLNGALIKFQKVLAETRAGKGGFVELLGKDSEFVNKIKGIKDVEKAFEFYMKTLGQIPDSANQVQFAMAGMGKSGAENIELAEEAAKGNLKTLFETRAAMGLIGTDTANAFDGVGDLFETIKTQFKVLQTGVVVQLLPSIKQLAYTISGWITANQPMLIALAQKFADMLPGAIDTTFQAIQSLFLLVQQWVPRILAFIEVIGGWGNVFKIVAGIIVSQLVVAIGGLIAALVALGVTIFTTPIGWISLAIAAAIPLWWGFYKVINYVKEAIGNAFSSLGEWIKNTIPFGEKLVSIFTTIWDIIVGIAGKIPIIQGLKLMFGAGEKIDQGFKALSGGFDKVMGAGTEGITEGVATTPSIQQIQQEAKLKVYFENQPQGMRIDVQNQDSVPLDVYSGFKNIG